jgi:prepilin-type processing-associated H-X9-DG protein
MKPIRDIEETIRRKLHVTAGPAMHDRVLARVRRADAQTKETTPAPREPRLRSRIVRNPRMKWIAAAAVVAVVGTGLIGIWHSGGQVYAFSQTVEAMQGKRSFHIQTYFQHRRKDEFWAEFDEDGNLLRFRQHEGDPKAPMVTLWEDNVMSRYYCGLLKMSLVENSGGGLEGLEEFDPETIVEEIDELVAEGKAVMEIEEHADHPDLMMIHVTHGKTLRKVLTVDAVTKFVLKVDDYWSLENGKVIHKGIEVLEYNEIMDPALFAPEFPEDTIIMDQVTQEVGMAQGDMTNEEAAMEICRRALEAWAQGDYAAAGKLFGGAPKRMLTQLDHLRPARIISIGQPELIEYMTPRYWVQCEYEIERDGQAEVISSRLGVFGVDGHPGRWYVSTARIGRPGDKTGAPQARTPDGAYQMSAGTNLSQIGKACWIYADDHDDKFPPDLETLVRELDLPPQCLESKRRPKNFDGPSYIYIPGQTLGMYPGNFVAYEDPRYCQEGVSVLFLDGHVEFMKPDAFREELKGTYDRLGRPTPRVRFKDEQKD